VTPGHADLDVLRTVLADEVTHLDAFLIAIRSPLPTESDGAG
jgi:hypothetical protein